MAQSPPIADPNVAAANKWAGDTKDAPRAALQFRSPCKFASAGGTDSSVPFSMTARTGDAINHWYWGRCVHDMSGMILAKPTLPVDWCHDANEAMGFADKFDVSTGDLNISGKLIPMPDDEDDRATEVIYKQKAGVPYEASIDFSGDSPVIEYVPIDASVLVNGKQFAGPGVVFRQWTLRSVAICLYGADSDTNTEFSAEANKVAITKFNGGTMPDQKTETVAATTPATPAAPAAAVKLTDTPAAPAVVTPAAAKPQDKYITAFGDVGARWFLDNKPLEDCVTEFTNQLKSAHATEIEAARKQFAADKAALQSQLDAANAKLAAIDRGDKGVTFTNAEGGNVDPKAAKLTQHLGENLSRFASGIKMPVEQKK